MIPEVWQKGFASSDPTKRKKEKRTTWSSQLDTLCVCVCPRIAEPGFSASLFKLNNTNYLLQNF